MNGKRLFDVALSLVLAPPAAGIVAIAAIAVRIDSRGPAILRQERIGQNELPFTCLKLRTMSRDTPDGASHLIGASSITRVGKVLRATKIDELPQIVNVLLGDMSFVGPRPCLPSQVELIEQRRSAGVATSRPGITGVSQVIGLDMSEPKELAVNDANYLGPWSMRRDVSILTATISGGGLAQDAARAA